MSALFDTPLYEVAPAPLPSPLSTEFMTRNLAESGLSLPEDNDCIHAYPTAPEGFNQHGVYCIRYPNDMVWTKRHDVPKGQTKYIANKGMTAIWHPPVLSIPQLQQAKTIYLIEGEKKAAKFFKQFRLPTIGMKGCYGYCAKFGGSESILLPDLQEILGTNKKLVVVFDSDIEANMNIQMAASRLIMMTRDRFTEVIVCKPPEGKGADDWLVANPDAKVTDLITIPNDLFGTTWKALYTKLNCIMIRNKDGIPIKPQLTEDNAYKILNYQLQGRLSSDFYNGFMFDNEALDNETLLRSQLLCQLQEDTEQPWKPGAVNTAISMILARTQTNHILDHLMQIKWDGTPRLNNWASSCIKADNPKRFIEEWGRIMMTGLVLRIIQPGTQVDHCFILSGRQGIGKTTFFRRLSEIDGHMYYTVINNAGASDNGSLVSLNKALRASIIADMDEGILLSRADVEHAKSLISTTVGQNRAFQGSAQEKYPRGNIFVSTANRTEILKDTTGSRRFLILKAKQLAYLEYAEKLQIMAEVIAKEKELRASDWFKVDPSAKSDDLDSLTEYERSLSVEDFLNREHQESDDVTHWLIRLFETPKELAQIKATGESFITSGYLHHKAENAGLSNASKNFIGRRLNDLVDSSMFPFALIKYKPRIPQLVFQSTNMQHLYTDGIDNDQAMLTGYRIIKK